MNKIAIPDAVPVLNFESFLGRVDMIFTQAFTFLGDIDSEIIEKSYRSVVSNIGKFSCRQHSDVGTEMSWVENTKTSCWFECVTSLYPEESVKQYSAYCYENMRGSGLAVPLALIVINDQEGSGFTLALMSDHAYVDAQSSNHILNLIVRMYNALTGGLPDEVVDTETAARQLHTLGAMAFVSESPKALSSELHTKNIELVAQYPVVTHPAIDITDAIFKEFIDRIRVPSVATYGINRFIRHYRSQKKYQHLSKNSIISAVLAKSYSYIDPKIVNANRGEISFGVAVSLPTDKQREKICGNYVVTVTVTVEVINCSLMEIAESIQDRIQEFKLSNQMLSRFLMREEYFGEELVAIKDPHAFYVTNWTNQSLRTKKLEINGCNYIKQLGLLNVNPESKTEASYVNKQGIIICLSPNDELSISLTPSVTKQGNIDKILSIFPWVIDESLKLEG